MSQSVSRKYNAFTLIELLVAIVVLAIMAAIAVPSFQGFIANQQVKGAADRMLFSFMYARSEAVKRRQVVTVLLGDGALSVEVGGKMIREETLKGVSVVAEGSNSVYFDSQGYSASRSFQLCDLQKKAAARVVRLGMTGQARVELGGGCGD